VGIARGYDAFYKKGGWYYDSVRELNFLRSAIIKPLRISRGARLLELGCGMGLHAALLSGLGLDVEAVDVSEVAIRHAGSVHSGPRYVHADAHDVLKRVSDPYDVILARGMSWFHYELEGRNRNGIDVPKELRAIEKALRRKGLFVLQIRTDFTGTWHSSGIRNHTWGDLGSALQLIGDIVLYCDWSGRTLATERAARTSRLNACIGVRVDGGVRA
jgi:SAM-dependent methyltransferase